MGRAERRRQQKMDKKKTRTYVLTQNDMDRMKNQMVEAVANELLESVFGISVMVLHDKFGELMRREVDGKSREERFFDMCLNLYDAYENGYLTLDDIRKTLQEECGAEFKRRT